jgi:S1-C subfamily serine protease
VGKRGVSIRSVSPGTPAYHAGLRQLDRITSLDGNPVRDTDDVFLLLGMSLAGKRVRLGVVRSGSHAQETIEVVLAKYYHAAPFIASRRPPALGGLRVDYTSILSQRAVFPFWQPTVADGVIIREVVPGSPADRAKLQPDKVITAVDGKPVHTPAEYYKAVANARGKVELTILTSENSPEQITLELK